MIDQHAVGRYLRMAAVVLAVGLGIALSQPARAVTLTVCAIPGAECSYTTIQSAVTAASAGDVISITAGTYVENNIVITKPLSLAGAGTASTIVDGNATNRVFAIMADVALSDLTVQNGYVTGNGAGILASGALTLTNVNVISNTASGSDASGGGVYANEAAVLAGGLFQGNQASASGGGLHAWSTLVLSGTHFLSNTVTGTGANGGGASAYWYTAVSGALFQGNQAPNLGGGLFCDSTLTLIGTNFIGNTAGSGGGAGVVGKLLLTGGLFQENQVSAYGGGLWVNNTLVLTGTQFLSNTGGAGGGANTNAVSTLSNALFQANQAATGAGLYATSPLTLTATQFMSNTAAGSNARGGGAYAGAHAMVSAGQFQGNQAGSYGGGLFSDHDLALTSSQFIHNTAGGSGGALATSSSGNAQLVNGLLAGNTAGRNGAAIYAGSTGDLSLIQTTIASPTIGSKSAIYVDQGTVSIRDTIFANYAQAIAEASSGMVTSDYNLFYNAPTSVLTGSHSLMGADPLFVAPLANNYRLQYASPATSRGSDAGVPTDLDGVARANPPTIGAYEAPLSILAITKSASITADVAYHGIVTYTIVLSNSGTAGDPNTVMTDVLPTKVAFSQWVTMPAGTLRNGNAITWTGMLTNGSAITFTFTVTHTGTLADVVANTAFFSGTLGAGSAAATFLTVQKIATTAVLTSTPNPAALGQPLTFTATVSPLTPFSGTPTGFVTFKAGETVLGVSAVQTETAVAAYGQLPGGVYTVTAQYGGDTNYQASISDPITQVVRDPYTLTVTKVGTGTVSSTPSGIACGTRSEARFPVGEVVTLDAVPGNSDTFDGWSGACAGTGACAVKIVEGQNIVTATFSTLVIHVAGDLDIWHPLFFSVTLPIASYDLCKVDFGDGTQVPCIPLLSVLTETAGAQAAVNGAASITVSANHIYAVPGTHKVVFAAFYHGGTALARLTITISAGHAPLYFPSIRTK